MLTRILKILFLCCMIGGLLEFVTPSYAILNLELTRGVDSAIPIAVVPFQVQGNEKPPVDVSQVIQNDLQNSGEFKVLDIQQMSQFPHQLHDVTFDYWRGLNINDLVIGRVQAQGNGHYQIIFYLVDIYKDKNQQQSAQDIIVNKGIDPIILSKSYEVTSGQLRQVAHKIADEIFENLLGVSGIFSTKIAYILVTRSDGEPMRYALEVADADGFNPKAILISHEPIMSPAWSPNGKEIAYVSFENRHVGIYISDVATGKRRLVTEFPGINGAPAWSPNGKQLAIVLSKGDAAKIFTVDLSHGSLRQLTNGWSIDTEPSWSPDGKSIIFTSDRGGSPQVYAQDLETGKVERLTYNGSYNTSASLTTDGKSMVMLHRDSGQYNIAVEDMDTGDLDVLTQEDDAQSPSIAPNGKMVIYASRQDDRSILAMTSIDGRIHLQLPENKGNVWEPAWGPIVKK